MAKSLKKYGYDAAPIHGDLDQSQRTRTLDGFRDGTLRFLVASDVAARGLDVPSVSHVFNFDVPSHAEDYVHRIGRTGRAGRDGKAVMICVPRDEKNLADIERLVQREIPRIDNPLQSAAPAEDKPAKTEKSSDDKPKRSRSRSRKKDEAESTQGDAAANADTKTESKPEEQPKRGRGRRGSGGGQSDKSDRGGNKVVGLGDHTPEFIGLSFKERSAG